MGVVTALRAEQSSGFESWQREESFVYSSGRPELIWGLPSLLFNWSPGFPAREWNRIHSTAASAEIKSEWSCTSAPPVCLHGVNRDKFTSLLQRIIFALCALCYNTVNPDSLFLT
jgi:hypothetical protein